ncbi:hypothetical protein V8E53_002967, partial [Lactarius tabidus]
RYYTGCRVRLFQIPGSHVIASYSDSSHQSDSGCIVLKVLLALFTIRDLLQSLARAETGEKCNIHFLKRFYL